MLNWATADVRALIKVGCWHTSVVRCESIQSNTASLAACFFANNSTSLAVTSSADIDSLEVNSAPWLDANVYSNFYKGAWFLGWAGKLLIYYWYMYIPNFKLENNNKTCEHWHTYVNTVVEIDSCLQSARPQPCQDVAQLGLMLPLIRAEAELTNPLCQKDCSIVLVRVFYYSVYNRVCFIVYMP